MESKSYVSPPLSPSTTLLTSDEDTTSLPSKKPIIRIKVGSLANKKEQTTPSEKANEARESNLSEMNRTNKMNDDSNKTIVENELDVKNKTLQKTANDDTDKENVGFELEIENELTKEIKNEDAASEKSKMELQAQSRLARFLKMNEDDMANEDKTVQEYEEIAKEEDMESEDFRLELEESEMDETEQAEKMEVDDKIEEDSEDSLEENKALEKTKNESQAHLSRFLKMSEEDGMKDDDDMENKDIDVEHEQIGELKFDDDFNVAGPSGYNRNSSTKRLLGESDDDSTDTEESASTRERRKNEKYMAALMVSLRDPELEKTLASLNPPKGKASKLSPALKSRRKRGNQDSAFKFTGYIPTERRKSSRLRHKNPEYAPNDLDGVHETTRNIYFKRPDYKVGDDSIEDLEKIVYKPKNKRKSHGKRKVEEHVIIPVEDVTQNMLDNIATRVKGKVYSSEGTTCHQCRQKTLDQKTCCRNPDCYGIFGMFCGVCIKNRYGEDAAEVLLNPNWICPVCRGKCNCSICRTKQGKRPTGILAPLAQQQGYESVDHFLERLKGEGDKPDEDEEWALKKDPEALIGFSDDGRKAHFQNGSSALLNCTLCGPKDSDDLGNLLGFSSDGEFAIMEGYKKEPLLNTKNFFLSALNLVKV